MRGSDWTKEGEGPRTSLRAHMISTTYLRFCATLFGLEQVCKGHAWRMRERKRRCRRDFGLRPRRAARRAKSDSVVEIELPHDFHKRRNRLQISLLERNVRAAQRLGQPRDLEASIVFGRIEPSLRQGLTDSATNRRRACLCVAPNLLSAVARHEQVEISLAPLDQCFAADFAQGALVRPFGDRLHFIGHERSLLLIQRYCTLDSIFPQHVFGS